MLPNLEKGVVLALRSKASGGRVGVFHGHNNNYGGMKDSIEVDRTRTFDDRRRGINCSSILLFRYETVTQIHIQSDATEKGVSLTVFFVID